MVVTDIKPSAADIPVRETFDKDYNIIQPEESLEKAVSRLRKMY